MRPLPLAALLTIPALAACAHHSSYGPSGLAYQCGSEQVRIVYNDQGFLPGITMREDGAQVPRSTAQLTYAGRAYPMAADWTVFDGLRYRSVEPYNGTHALVWTATGEDAAVAEIPVAGGEPRTLAECSRIRTVAGLTGATGHDAGHGAAPAEASHHR